MKSWLSLNTRKNKSHKQLAKSAETIERETLVSCFISTLYSSPEKKLICSQMDKSVWDQLSGTLCPTLFPFSLENNFQIPMDTLGFTPNHIHFVFKIFMFFEKKEEVYFINYKIKFCIIL